jgi:hypothetical protein
MAISESDLGRVEKAFGVRLPGIYRQLLVHGCQPAGEIAWFDSAQLLIEMNTSLFEDDDWDPGYIAIATNGAGDYFCLELDTSDVALFSHEDRDFLEIGPFSEWICNPFSPASEAEASSVILRVLGCAAIALLLLFLFAAPIWFVLRRSP